MKANYRYYKWISEDDDSHFIYVNFKENESGVYTVSAYNTSGFSGTEAIEKYLDIVKAEAAEANKAASAGRSMIVGAAWWKTTIPQRLVRAPSDSR